MAECEAVEDRYVLHERIGRGSFGEVWRGQDRQTGEVVAIKVIDLDQAEDEIDDIVQEIKVMAMQFVNLLDAYKSRRGKRLGKERSGMARRRRMARGRR